MKKRSQREETHTSTDLKRYLGALRRERMEVMKTFLNPDTFLRLERRVLRLESKVR